MLFACDKNYNIYIYFLYCRELNHARQQFTTNMKKETHSPKPNNTDLSGVENLGSESSIKDSDLESTTSSTLQWQDDPEFQNKVK